MDILLTCISTGHEDEQWLLALEGKQAQLHDAEGNVSGQFTPRQAASDWRFTGRQGDQTGIEIPAKSGLLIFMMPANSEAAIREFQQPAAFDESRFANGFRALLMGAGGIVVGIIALIVGVGVAIASSQPDGSYVIWNLPFIIAALGICGGLLKFLEAAVIFIFGGFRQVPAIVWGLAVLLVIGAVVLGVYAFVSPPAPPQTISAEERARIQAQRAPDDAPPPAPEAEAEAETEAEAAAGDGVPTTVFDPTAAHWQTGDTDGDANVATATTVFDPAAFGGQASVPEQPEIIEANYGAHSRTRDVAERLRQQMRDGSLNIEVSNDTMGGDPIYGTPKQLKVKYRWRGEVRDVSLSEGQRLVLPPRE